MEGHHGQGTPGAPGTVLALPGGQGSHGWPRVGVAVPSKVGTELAVVGGLL
jgi:hypothetical protein